MCLYAWQGGVGSDGVKGEKGDACAVCPTLSEIPAANLVAMEQTLKLKGERGKPGLGQKGEQVRVCFIGMECVCVYVCACVLVRAFCVVPGSVSNLEVICVNSCSGGTWSQWPGRAERREG